MVRMIRQKDKQLAPDGTEELQSYNGYLLTSFYERKINLLAKFSNPHSGPSNPPQKAILTSNPLGGASQKLNVHPKQEVATGLGALF